MNRKALYWKNICKIPFGAHALVLEYRNIANTLRGQTQGAICLGPTGNTQGNYNFLSIRTDKNITHGQFTEVTTPKNRNETSGSYGLGKKTEGLIFENCVGVLVDSILPDDEANEAFR